MKHYAFEIETTRGRVVRAYRGSCFGNAKARAEAKHDVVRLIRHEEISKSQYDRVLAISEQNDKTCKALHVTTTRRLR